VLVPDLVRFSRALVLDLVRSSKVLEPDQVRFSLPGPVPSRSPS
jgi:hypothetical protein